MRFCFDWLDNRLGYRKHIQVLRERTLPNGPSWLLTSASCLLGLLVIQIVTGLLLMASYSPSIASAWASVHFIDQLSAGRFIRGIHHFASHAMIVVLLVHVARVLLTAAFRKPRELVWITGLLMIPLVIVWTVTGNPLSGSQKGLAQIEVEGHILGAVPLIGPPLQRLLIGGDEVGNLTLTHLYFLHVGLLPLIVGGLCAVHLQQIYRHGSSPVAAAAHGSTGNINVPYWPDQSVRNWAVLAAVMAVISWWAWTEGAPLDAPADAALPSTPRPEWYFRWIFELRRSFTGDSEFLVTVVLPAAILGFFMMIPLFDHWLARRWSMALRTTTVIGAVGAWSFLTYASLARDWADPEYLAARQQSRELADRARFLANRQQITAAGAAALLQSDPRTQGPLLFARHCQTCHDHLDGEGHGIAAENPTAPNLFGFGSRDWVLGMLDPQRIVSPQVFGNTKFKKGEMAAKIRSLFKEADADGTTSELKDQLRLIAAALSAEADLSHPLPRDKQDEAEIQRGQKLVAELGCTECHKFHGEGDLGLAPDLTGYASHEWLTSMISNPADERFYPDDRNDRMPAFAEDQAHPDLNLLSIEEQRLLAEWLRGEWIEPAPEQVEPQSSSVPPGPQVATGR